MNPTDLSASLRQMRGEAEQSGWDDAVSTLRRAEQATAAGHLSGRGRWYRRARKAVSRLAAAALTARTAADTARQVASQPAPTAAQLTAVHGYVPGQ